MDEEILISQVYTTCKNCVFSKLEDGAQVGCKLDKIKHYEDAGINIINVQEDGKKFFLIDGRFCLYYRNEELMKNYPPDKWETIVKEQVHIPYHIILFVEKDHTFADVKRGLRLIQQQEYQPSFVTLINKQYTSYVQEPDKYIKPSLLLEELQNRKFHRFSLKNIYDDEMSDRDIIDLAFDNTQYLPYPFYIVFRANYDIPKDFISCLDKSIFVDMKQIGFVKPVDDLNGMIVNKTAHKKHAGNSFGVQLEKKIENFEEDADNFIFEAKDICPSLK